MDIRVPTTDTSGYPYAIISKLRDTGEEVGYELHFLLSASSKADWKAHAEGLRASGQFEWVRFTTMNFMDEETGELLGR